MVKSVEDLDVFNIAHKLTLDLYKMTAKFPKEEKFGLASQIRKAASSINANLIEGSHRNTSGEYKQFVGVARGSAGELKYHLLLAKDLNYISENDYLALKDKIDRVSKMLSGLRKAL